ncbi:MAG: diadenylate cyclase CdaA [Acidobacteriota bacterium]|nr:diadenylate cyclase CdaA [Acidobacteriota bacterium]
MQSLQDLFNSQGLSIWDLFDLLIIWFIIYSLFRFMRGRRTMQMAIALFVLFTAYFLADALQLVVVHQIISSLLSIIPVAIIVLFQDELRRILASLVSTSFFRSSAKTSQTVLENIFQAAVNMSRNRIGALIVFEHGGGLAPIIEGGVKLDALVSTTLLMDIFNPKSNLHDGAVVIAKERIASAACILPLTRAQGIPQHYGTRHRAAIGMSEEADCTVVVVSEETGNISFARGGEIYTLKDHSLPQLVETYHNLQLPEGEERSQNLASVTRKPKSKSPRTKNKPPRELVK